jgi:hypothetical protein
MKPRRRLDSMGFATCMRRRRLFERLEDRTLLAVLSPVNDTSLFPNSAVVQLNSAWDSNGNGELDPPVFNSAGELTNGDRINTCSGAMISRYQVLTAAHCVFNPEYGGMAKWTFAHPGRSSHWDRPFGEARALYWNVPNSYLSSTNDYFDVAVIALDRNIGDETGWFGLKAIEEPRDPGPNFPFRPQPLNFHVNVLHYPAKHQYAGQDLSGTRQFQGDTHYTLFPESWVIPGLDPQYFINMKNMWTAKGSSGAPLFNDEHQIIGVLHGGSDIPLGQSGTDYYTKFNGSQAFPLWWIEDALAANPTPIDRPSLVNRNAWQGDPEANLQTLRVGVGQEVTVDAPIVNVGTSDALNVRVRFRLSTDKEYDSSDTLLGDVVVPRIAAFSEQIARFTTEMPQQSEGTERHIVWAIDPLNSITERTPLYLNRILLKGSASQSHYGHNVTVKYADDLQEPNNTRSSATLLPAGQWLSSVYATGVQYDTDFYKVVVPVGHSVLSAKLTFNHQWGDIDLDLQDATGTRIASSQGYENIEQLQWLVTPGTYYLRVYHGNEGNLYDLRWESAPAADLAATNISVTSQPLEAGHEFDVRFRVTNSTAGPASTYEAAVYLSRDASIDPNTDILIGRKEFPVLLGNSTSSQQVIAARLPAAAHSFWNGDGTYYVGIFVDSQKAVTESDESNNYDQAIGTDIASLQVVVHPYGTFTTTTVSNNFIATPQFDAWRGNLTKVEVVVTIATGLTGSTVMPPTGIVLIPDAHGIDVTLGPIRIQGVTAPVPASTNQSHLHPIVGGGGSSSFSGSQLTSFKNGAQRWDLPSNARTLAGYAGHTHSIDSLQFIVTTKFYFDPPPSDLHAVSLSLNAPSTINAKDGEKYDVDYQIINSGPGPAPRFEIGIFISPDPIITREDTRIGWDTVELGLPKGSTHSRRQTLGVPRSSSDFWEGDGTYYIGMIIDVDDDARESNENNNGNIGLGVDLGTIDVMVKPPGTEVVRLYTRDFVRMPKFEVPGSVLQRVEAWSYTASGFTNSGGSVIPGVPLFHTHTFEFQLGRFLFNAVALPSDSGFPHQVAPAALARATWSASEVGDFLLADQVFNLPKPIVSSREMGHIHELIFADFDTEIWYYFEPLLQIAPISISTNSAPQPGKPLELNWSIEKLGNTSSSEFDAVIYLLHPDGYTQVEIGRKRNHATDAGDYIFSDSLEIQLPPIYDPIWSQAGVYSIKVQLEAVEGGSPLPMQPAAGEGIDTVSFQLALDREISPLHIESPKLEQLQLDANEQEEFWFRVSPTHAGPLSLVMTGFAEQTVVYEVTSSFFAADGSFVENSILPYEVARLTAGPDQTPRVDLAVDTASEFLVRVAAPSANTSLTVAHLLEVLGSTLVVHHSSPTDQLRTSMQGSPILEINDLRYDLSSLGVSLLQIPVGATANSTQLQPLAGISQELTISEHSAASFLLDLVGAIPTIHDGVIEFAEFSSVVFPDSITPRLLRVASWQNMINRFDVNNDGLISPTDALIVINQINRFPSSELPELVNDSNYPTRFFDTNGDTRITPIDALIVVNYLNRRSTSEGELDAETNPKLRASPSTDPLSDF